jgi:hypothetical protein
MSYLRIGGIWCVLLLALLATGSGLQAQARPAYEPRFDLTGNGVVDGADAGRAAQAWDGLVGDDPCALGARAALDLSGDGCLDVADLQLLAANIGGVSAEVQGDMAAGLAALSTWTVTSSNLDPDTNPGDGVCRTADGRCSLRAAIQEANRSVGEDVIGFDIRNPDGTCPALVTIVAPAHKPPAQPYNELVIDDPRGDGTTIDGYTQCDASPNTEPLAGNAVIKIELRGNLTRDIHGLHIMSPNNVVRGLALFNWDRQIELYGSRARYNRVEGNFIGTNAAQLYQSSSLGTHHSEGLRIQVGASYNVVGCGSFAPDNSFVPCTDPAQAYAARNIVAGNGNDGIHLERPVFHNRIVGNYIGLKQDGETVNRNRSDGVDFEQGSQHNWLGGESVLERNVISGNDSEGIEISHGTWTQFNKVVGNYFGLNAAGTAPVPNKNNGISFEDTVDQNEAYNNVVSGNWDSGFRFYVLATRNIVRNNVVGLAADNLTPMPNRDYGVHVHGGSQYNQIVENVIAHNDNHGVFLTSTSDEDNNYIGKTYYNTISRNSLYANKGAGISFYGKRDIFPNENRAAPRIERANSARVAGTGCAGCKIEVFVADKAGLTSGGDDQSGEGRQFVGEGFVDGIGRFNFALTAPVAPGAILTATATDASGNTSPFARNIAAGSDPIEEATPAPAPPTSTPLPTATPEPTPTFEPGEAPEYTLYLPQLRR